MKLLRQNHKKFEYKPRYYKGEGNPYEIRHKFDQFRTTTGKNKNLKAKFNNAIEEFRSSEKKFNKTILIIATILVFIFLYFIDFDLSIFLGN